ncbi:RNA 2',3'-cyclic phosphodiesterase [Fodinibius sp. Rm-B-1B1-1]|uniref:RNA 2',3'-cyclic phosphodiesterase n=1 Tax=Fodinibius alkaliphilus TaxID=3140241 RepID=UPI00315A008D
MRLFIAIPISDAVKQKIGDLQQPIEGIRWQENEQMHLTLKFVGEADMQLKKSLQKRLDEIEHPTFTIDLKGFGYFPERGRPKVLWIGLRENSSLRVLQQKVEQKCQAVGIAPEDRPYKPHVTMARVQGASKRTVNAFINEHKKFTVRDMMINQFVLYKSKLQPDGAQHSRLQTFLLNDGT